MVMLEGVRRAIELYLRTASCEDLYAITLGAGVKEVVDAYGAELRRLAIVLMLSDREGASNSAVTPLSLIESFPDSFYGLLLGTLLVVERWRASRALHRLLELYKSRLEKLDEDSLVNLVKALGIYISRSEACFLVEYPHIDWRSGGGPTKICYRYKIKLYDYLMMIKGLLTESVWRLALQAVKEGYVYLDSRRKVERLVLEYMRDLLMRRVDSLRLRCRELVNELKGLLQGLAIEAFEPHVVEAAPLSPNAEARGLKDVEVSPEKLLEVARKRLEAAIEGGETLTAAREFLPPCMFSLVEKLVKGENLSHHQRFAVATFLLNLGLSVEDVLRLFKYAPDFNERVARYQIEHLAGLRGSRKKYRTYKCETLKSLNICAGECGVRHPLAYVVKVLRYSDSHAKRASQVR